MNLGHQLAQDISQVYSGKNWTAVDLKSVLEDVTWQEALQAVGDLNTIATLVHHMTYYVVGVTAVLQGGELTIKDKYSFDHPTIAGAHDWLAVQQKVYANVEVFVGLVQRLTDKQLSADMADPKYGSLYRNIAGIVQHCYYHLGQIVLLKKLIRASQS